MPVNNVNIIADQGATLLFTFTWTDATGTAVDLTGFEAHMQVRSGRGATDLELDCSTVGYDLDSGNGYIVLGDPLPTDGTVNINVPSVAMAAFTPGLYHYDLDLISAGATPVVTKLLGGTFLVNPGVTVDVVA